MKRSIGRLALLFILAGQAVGTAGARAVAAVPLGSESFQDEPIVVEPSELERRQDLLGKEVVVDDRVQYYVPRQGAEPDELQLKRTPITFLVPARIRPVSTRMTSALVRGTLRRDGSRLVCDVTSLKALPKDLDRLERGLASLPPKDFETRKAWVRWAERRAREFGDDALRDRARALEGEALRIESEMKRVGVDAPREWLAMALDARRRAVAEPEPSALAHRALRAMLGSAQTADDLKRLIQEIESFFPRAARDRESGRVNLARDEAAYAADPAGIYRSAAPQVRTAFDRRLWADASARLLELQATGDFQSALATAEQAQTNLPERPDLPVQLLELATRQARQNLGSVRLEQAKALAAIYRDKLNQVEEGLKFLRDWLKVQQDRLSSTDAEGALRLANLYEDLLQDRVTCVELLRRAWKLDPGSKELAEAFRTRGFRKVKDEWIESAADRDAGETVERPSGRRSGATGLRGLTPDEVRLSLGEPKYVNFVSSRGQLIEQWIFVDTRAVRFVNIVHTPGEMKARVVADYSLSPTLLKGASRSSR